LNIIKRIFINKFHLSYLLTGVVNTVFGYFFGILCYLLFYKNYGIVFVGIVTNIVCINFSFLTYKLIVFKTKKNWFSEYIKSWLSNGLVSIFAIIMLWFLVEVVHLNIFISNFFSILSSVIISYISNRWLVFKQE
jgi:putative flippase GtrA